MIFWRNVLLEIPNAEAIGASSCQDPKKPKKHGPYYQLSYVHQGKSTTQFIQKELLRTVEQQLKNFKMFRLLTAEWVDLAIAREKLAFDKQRLKIEVKNK